MLLDMKSYIQNTDASASIETVVLVVAALSVSIAVGWWIFNTVKGQADNSSCSGNDSPFCIE